MSAMQWTVSEQEGNKPLLQFLASKLGVSGKKAKQRLDARSVFVNERRTWMARHRLRPGDVVRILPSEAPNLDRIRLRVLFEDDSLLVLDKRAGVPANGEGSMEVLARARFSAPGLTAVHRLDRDTSGCLLLAKTPEAQEAMLSLFREHAIRKTYHAIVAGRLDPPVQTIKLPLQGQRAETHVKLLDAAGIASHVLVRIETGRTHQIRKHLHAVNHPVLGDRVYGTGSRDVRRAPKPPRQMLHASGLEFPHPQTRRTVRVNAPLPHDFRRCLKGLRLT